jgi:hypothetical protein
MQHTDFVPATFTAKVRKNDFEVKNVQDLPQAALAYIFRLGLQTVLNNAAIPAGKDAKWDKVQPEVQAKWDNLLKGVVANPRTYQPSDPVAVEAWNIANTFWQAQVRAEGKKPADIKAEERTEAIKAILEANPAIQDKAKIIVGLKADIDIVAPKADK